MFNISRMFTMKTLLLILAVCTLFSGKLVAQSYLSPRVGNEIDRIEKEYFGLFPTINGFVSAKAVSKSEQFTTLTITTLFEGRRKDTSLLIDAGTISKLAKYFDSYETVRIKENTVNWSVFKGIAAESPAINDPFHEPMETTIESLDGTSISGTLLWAEDSSLVLWKSEEPYNWRTLAQNASPVRVEQIKHIRLERQGGFTSGAKIGAYAGIAVYCVGLGVNYDDIKTGRWETITTTIFGGAIITACSAVAGGIIGSIIQQDFHADVNGSMENYLPLVDTLSKSSVIESYPPPELVRLINK